MRLILQRPMMIFMYLSVAVVALVVGLRPCVWADEPSPETKVKSAPPETLTNSIGLKLVKIPAGEFMMGSSETADDWAQAFPAFERDRFEQVNDERPRHKVRITRPFYLGMYEVTVGQFKKFVDEAPYTVESERDGTGAWGYVPEIQYFKGRDPKYSWRNMNFPQGDDHPVLDITFGDALAFCDWLSKKEGHKYRLPTEAEWEYACRAGTATRFYNGDDPEQLAKVANIFDAKTTRLFPQFAKYAAKSDDGYEFTSPVGKFPPNAFGLYDMHGGAWEWCSDWYSTDYYQKSPTDNPQGPETGERRVRRGGSWHTFPYYCRSSFRNYLTPKSRYILVGFRVVREE